MLLIAVLVAALAPGNATVADAVSAADDLLKQGWHREAGFAFADLADANIEDPRSVGWLLQVAHIAQLSGGRAALPALHRASARADALHQQHPNAVVAELASVERFWRGVIADELWETSSGCSAFDDGTHTDELLAVYVVLFPLSPLRGDALFARAQRGLSRNLMTDQQARRLFVEAAFAKFPDADNAAACAIDPGVPECRARVGAGRFADAR